MAEPVPTFPQTSSQTEPVPRLKQNSSAVEPTELSQVGTLHSARTLHSALSARPWHQQVEAGFYRGLNVVSRSASRTSHKVRRFASERPIELVLGVAITSFLTGAVLRIWRSSYE